MARPTTYHASKTKHLNFLSLPIKVRTGFVPVYLTFHSPFLRLGNKDLSSKQTLLCLPFQPRIVVLDGVDAFVDGGPMTGKRAVGNVFLASADRVAINAVGVALLKLLGSNPTVMDRPIFTQEQIARAGELGLGASSPAEIELQAVNEESRELLFKYSRDIEQGLKVPRSN